MAATVLRKAHYVTFSKKIPQGFPDFLGEAKIGGMQFCYFYRGRPFPTAHYEFEVSTVVIPQGFRVVKRDRSLGAPAPEHLVKPFLVDVIPEGGQPAFVYEQWHYCLNEGGEIGTFCCAKPIPEDGDGDGGGGESTGGGLRQIVLFYDDSTNHRIPKKKNEAGEEVPRDPNERYYFLPLLMPNQTLFYYLLPESEEKAGNIIENWNRGLNQEKGTPFFVPVNGPILFDDALQIFFTEVVAPFWD
jgi:hypothetical protein